MNWVAGASVFSGLPDPTWPISDELGEQLERLWESLPVAKDEAVAQPPPLGYRGCFVVSPDGRRRTAYRQAVRLEERTRTQTRFDRRRDFEAQVLLSAPEGTLPPWVNTESGP